MRNLLLLVVIATGPIFCLSGCKTQPAETMVAEATAVGRVHVLFADGADPVAFLKAFPDFGLESKGRASRSQNKYAFVYNASRLSPEALKRELEQHKDVLQVEVMKK